MKKKHIYYTAIIALFFLAGCKEKKETAPISVPEENTNISTDSVIPIEETEVEEVREKEEEFLLTEENAIDFFFNYSKTITEDKVKITTSLGSFTVQLYDNVPYHKANFIYLAKKNYFENTLFHRVVKNFIIQGGSTDNREVARKRRTIGRYLLPPDTRKGYRHHRGTLSVPSSDIDNPHKLASPYEFFIVVTKPGAYHLDGNYTPFGRVIQGMDVVDLINNQPVDSGDWPKQNIFILKTEVLE